MGTFDVTLPSNQKIVFPALCVVCEKPDPNGAIKLSFLGIKTAPVFAMGADAAVYDGVDPKYYGSNTSTAVDGIPACTTCASSLKWYHRILKFGYYTAWIPGLLPILFLHLSTWITAPFMVLCAASPGILTLIFPPSFGMSLIDNQANFEFKSERVAREFLKLNEGAETQAAKATAKASPPNDPELLRS